MRILTLFGTRPEIIRLSLIIREIDRFAKQFLVHTGQNYDPSLSGIFLEQLGIRKLDYHLGIQSASFGEQASQILSQSDNLFAQLAPDRLLILGDTNSGLAAIAAARRGIKVYHLEAGNRCYDNRVPEETNRRIIDHCSDVLLPYTHRSAANLVAEGIPRERIFVTGNPIFEVLKHFEPQISASRILEQLGVSPREYFLATLHRAENVDVPQRLAQLLEGLTCIASRLGKVVVVSVHPRTADRVAKAGLSVDSKRVRLEKPFGLFDFVHLEKNALGIVTDSGTVQEEACIFGIPNITIRDVTERPETTECGSNTLVGTDPDWMLTGMELVLGTSQKWTPPEEYTRKNVAATVAKILVGYCR
jgi:UDP-N-acetylglucosamine 2-epimerase (non-hydrolysing)